MEFAKKHVLIAGSIFLLLVGLVLAIRQLYIMFAVLALLAPVSWYLSRGTLSALSVRREAPGLMKEGQQRRVRLTVANEGVRRRYFFTVRDRLPDGLEAIGEGSTLVPSLAADEQFTVEYALRARRRGVYEVGPALMEHSDLIGMYRFRREAGEPDELVVHPSPERIPPVWDRAMSLRAPQQPRRRFRDEGTEFYGTRPFVAGDDLRRVDWKATARRGQLIVRQYERAEAIDATMILDLQRAHHRGEGADATVERAVKLAASVAAQLLERGSSVGLVAAGGQDCSVPPSADPRQRVRLFDALARARADGRQSVAEVIAEHLPYLPAGGMVIIISPRLDGEPLRVVTGLRDRGYIVSWMVVEVPGDARLRADRTQPRELAARLADRGADTWLLESSGELAVAMRRVGRGG
ncbi:MAG: DUF58 domain-containing protein [Armatimonadota bacterium]|nr:DUF58 domain-containing protein [Armatimonadota bacterium]